MSRKSLGAGAMLSGMLAIGNPRRVLGLVQAFAQHGKRSHDLLPPAGPTTIDVIGTDPLMAMALTELAMHVFTA
jgi:hypothetical protein